MNFNFLNLFSPTKFLIAIFALLSTTLTSHKLGLALSIAQDPELITFEDKYILSQWLHLDLSLDGIASLLFLDSLEVLEGQVTSLIYNGNYTLTIDDLGNATGNSSSIVSGLYFGAPLEIELGSEFIDDNLGIISTNDNLGINSKDHKLGIAPKEIKFTSNGFWQQDEFPVKDPNNPRPSKQFTDHGMITRDPKNNGMGDLELTVKHSSGEQKLTGKFKYGKRGDDTVIKGNPSVPNEESTSVEIILPKTGKGISTIISKVTPERGREKKKTYRLFNKCTVIEQQKIINIQSTTINGATECELTADIVTVPEYSSNFSFLALGTLGAATTLKDKRKHSKEKELEKVS